MQPVLGTYVNIIAPDHDVIEKVFIEIIKLQKIFNFYDAESSLSKLNRSKKLKVPQFLYNLCKFSTKLYHMTGGIFNPAKQDCTRQGCISQLVFHQNHTIEKPFDTVLDFGGIAKGYIVDLAIRYMKTIAPYGCINAGGDIKCFGPRAWPLSVRHPFKPEQTIFLANDYNFAAASSCITTKSTEYGGKSSIYGQKQGDFIHATIKHRSCTMADALATIFLINPNAAAIIMHKSSLAFCCDEQGQWHQFERI